MEVESKADLHNELKHKFGQHKSKSTTDLDVPTDTGDTKAKPTTTKKKLFGGKDSECSGTQAPPAHKPLEHTISMPVSSTTEGGAPRVFVAHCDYTSQTEGCLSFSKGDKCVLVKNTPGGWWMVTINGKEGWTPSDYWDEELKVKGVCGVREGRREGIQEEEGGDREEGGVIERRKGKGGERWQRGKWRKGKRKGGRE